MCVVENVLGDKGWIDMSDYATARAIIDKYVTGVPVIIPNDTVLHIYTDAEEWGIEQDTINDVFQEDGYEPHMGGFKLRSAVHK